MPKHQSIHIGYKAAQTLYYAVGEHAERIGLPLSHIVTINFSMTDIAPEKATAAFQAIRMTSFNKWARRPCKSAGRPFPPTYAYCFENERDEVAFKTIGPGEPHNVHVHWLVHIPAARFHDFEMRVWEWLESLCGQVAPAGTIDIRPIDDAKGLRRYLLKGANGACAAHFGATASEQGLIIGRRSNTSINLGPSARIRYDRQMGIRRRAA